MTGGSGIGPGPRRAIAQPPPPCPKATAPGFIPPSAATTTATATTATTAAAAAAAAAVEKSRSAAADHTAAINLIGADRFLLQRAMTNDRPTESTNQRLPPPPPPPPLTHNKKKRPHHDGTDQRASIVLAPPHFSGRGKTTRIVSIRTTLDRRSRCRPHGKEFGIDFGPFFLTAVSRRSIRRRPSSTICRIRQAVGSTNQEAEK